MIRITRYTLAALACFGCGGDDEAITIPEALRGAYGRTDADAFFGTLGLEVDVDTLRFSELRLSVKTGKVIAADSLQVSDAELTWVQDDKPPQRCKGTIARQGERLLLGLFRVDSDRPCDSALSGEWSAWAPVTEIPADLHGVFGRGDVYAATEGVRIDAKSIVVAGTDSGLELVEGVAYEGRDDHLIVRKATWHELQCRGTISVKDDELASDLAIIEGTEPAPKAADAPPEVEDSAFVGFLGGTNECPALFGARWSIDTKALPQKAFDNGKVRIEIRGETVKTTTLDEQGLRCEQAILRTATRTVAESGRDGIPVLGGTVVVLTPAVPKAGADGCAGRLQNLAAGECARVSGAPCDPAMIASFMGRMPDIECPTHLVIGDPDANGRKVAVLPQSLQMPVCFEMTGYFE